MHPSDAPQEYRSSTRKRAMLIRVGFGMFDASPILNGAWYMSGPMNMVMLVPVLNLTASAFAGTSRASRAPFPVAPVIGVGAGFTLLRFNNFARPS